MADLVIQEGAVYTYTADYPVGCKGHRYRVLRVNVLSVPSYTTTVLVEAIDGPDAGLWFVCSPWNFSIRYRRAD